MEMIQVLKIEYETLKTEHEALKGLVVALTNEIAELKAKSNHSSTIN